MTRERIFSRGEHIGPYEVERVLATGGMGVVYEAKPLPERRGDLLAAGIDRVALKMMRLGGTKLTRYERKLLVERMDREFATLVKLTRHGHPNVVKVYDSGREDGVPYYVMELVDGITLDEALAEQPRWGEMMNVFGKLCGAVAFLHEVGVCHRDLKPSNVMLRRDGGEPVLIDFGICLPPSERTLTGAQELLGTPQYLSPEYGAHWMNPTELRPYVAAPTDDVWALGVMLYEVLTGGTPWRTPSDRKEALLKEIQEVAPPHPTDVNPKAPRLLGDVALAMLEKDYRKRPRNAMEVLPLLGEAAEFSDAFGRIPTRRPAPKALKTTWTGGDAEAQPVTSATPRQRARDTSRESAPPPPRFHLRELAAFAALVVVMLIGLWAHDRSMHAAMEEQRQELAARTATLQAEREFALAGQGMASYSFLTGGMSTPLGPLRGVIPAALYVDGLNWTTGLLLGEYPMPPLPIEGQKQAPCTPGEFEYSKACWWLEFSIKEGEHCPKGYFRHNLGCYSPIRDPRIPLPPSRRSEFPHWSQQP